MHKISLSFFLLLLCGCNQTYNHTTLNKTRRNTIIKIAALKPSPRSNLSLKNKSKVSALQPYTKLDKNLRFQVSQQFRKNKDFSWDLPKYLEPETDHIFSLRPNKTDSTIMIQLNKK